jgi:uncharacterized protein YlxW (UPF0749 family)
MKRYYILFLLVMIGALMQAQNDQDSISSVVDQYDELIEESNSYEEYKVIKKVDVKAFRKELKSSKDSLEKIIDAFKKEKSQLKANIKDLETDLKKTRNSLSDLQQAQDSIGFLGMQLGKSTYHILAWSMIALLLVICVLLFINYRRSNVVTKATKESMRNLEVEYEEYRRNAIEKQQQQGRQILDLQKSVKKKPNSGNAGPKQSS